ncbi:hypothetical protein E2C01_088264 [Portunus trituberculatus]|uniref:Uncharacterized protein n=1 Tax=Portunus trituberculatus TaxID=210409 RepID=A0A5B7JAA1_PORTR|nr:hypothetical protein [Portunus trituberculatus]
MKVTFEETFHPGALALAHDVTAISHSLLGRSFLSQRDFQSYPVRRDEGLPATLTATFTTINHAARLQLH